MKNLVIGFFCALAVVLASSVIAAPTATGKIGIPISFRKATTNGTYTDWVTLGTVASPCLANGTTASSASLTKGTWRFSVQGESVAMCDGNDADCASAPMDLMPGYVEDIEIDTGMAGSWHCRSAGALGYVTFRRLP
jgi:hypothetical protein